MRQLATPHVPEADFGGTSRPSDRKEPMRFSVRLRIHSKLVVTREKLGS
jgi:hypothetical protein